MRNRDEKIKNIERSVLPSTARKSARAERRLIQKRQRARERALLAVLRSAPDVDPDFRDGRRLSATYWMVLDRRSADKVGPLIRWAVATVNADPSLRCAALHDKVAHFATLLPDTLIGRHAVQHIEWALRYPGGTWADWRAEGAARRQQRRDQVAADAGRIIACGRHGDLNAALRKAYRVQVSEDCTITAGLPGRLLLGAHDIDAFADMVAPHDRIREIVVEVARRCHR